jgi:ABC-type multidrug transport system ATPase subunit
VIRELSASGRTVLFSTHDPNEASMVADAVMIIDEGRILDLGTPNGVITKDIIQYTQQMRIWSRSMENPLLAFRPTSEMIGD